MISLSIAADRVVNASRAAHLYRFAAGRRAQLAQARRARDHALLSGFRSESEVLTSRLEAACAQDEERVAAFETTVAPLEEAVQAHLAAAAAFTAAQGARFEGALDRKTAIRLRDDVEVCEQAVNIRKRELDAAARRSNSYLPSADCPPAIAGGEFVATFSKYVLNLEFHPELVQLFRKTRWFEHLVSEDDFAGVPFHALDAIERAANTAEQYETVVDARRYVVRLSVERFVEELQKFKAERAAWLRQKVATATADLQRVAAQVGVSQ